MSSFEFRLSLMIGLRAVCIEWNQSKILFSGSERFVLSQKFIMLTLKKLFLFLNDYGIITSYEIKFFEIC